MVILFDGVCNLCNASVNWIIDRDKNNLFKFASLQSEYGQSVIKKFNITGDYMDTVVLQEEGKVYLRSAAALRILKHLGGIYSIAYIFIIIPEFVRDFIYNVIAKNRYRWFGKQDACRIPSPDLKAKFLG